MFHNFTRYMFKGNEGTGRFRRECLIAIGTEMQYLREWKGRRKEEKIENK